MYHSTLLRRGGLRRTDATGNRVVAVGVVFFLCAVGVVGRLFFLQVVQNEYFSGLAAKAQDTYRKLAAERGTIFVRENGKRYPIVSNQDYYVVFSDPRKVLEPGKVVDTLTSVLQLEEAEWKAIATKLAHRTASYVVLRRKVTLRQVEKIRTFALAGVYDAPESYRAYSEPGFGGQLLGFVGYAGDQRVGQYGLEGYFDQELTGQLGSLRAVADAAGRPLAIGERTVYAPQDGDDIVLTMDRIVQLKTCALLQQGLEQFAAPGGTIIVLVPQTGAVLAMCSLPNFDPETYAQANLSVYNNPAIFTPYEPGSVFKPIAMAAAVDRNVVAPDDTYHDTGEIRLASGKVIRNSDLRAHGTQTMVAVLEKSLNTGAVHVVSKLGRETFRRYVHDFGFGSKTGITLDTEMPGDVSSLDRRGDIYSWTASFGQGITVTALQLAAAYGALSNGGRLMRPYLVAERIRADGTVLPTVPVAVRQVVTARTASTITGMLVQAVEGVYDHKAKLDGYRVAGKTGTAQIASPQGGYGSDVNHTFVGYLPADNPAFLIVVNLEKPTAVKHAADSTTVVFRRLAEFLVQYLQIPPERAMSSRKP